MVKKRGNIKFPSLFLKTKKRGLSTIVTTVILIVLVMTAVGIVWAVVNNLLSETKEDILVGKAKIELSIDKVYTDSTGLNVKLSRDIGKGELSGLRFIVSDGGDSDTIELSNIQLDELEKKNFNLGQYDGLIKEISVAPIIKISSSKERVGSISASKELTSQEAIEALGALSWWRLEGDAHDEIGGKTGILVNNPNCNIQGKFGEACYFDGYNDYIRISDTALKNVFDPGLNFSIGLWFNSKSNTSTWKWLFAKSYTSHVSPFYQIEIRYNTGKKLDVIIYNSSGSNYLDAWNINAIAELNQWHHVFVIADLSAPFLKVYLNGNLVRNDSTSVGSYSNWDSNITIGSNQNLPTSYHFNGTIDEVMIFDKALTENQVKSLYNFDYND